jgi:hypothetical protein
MFSSRIQDYGLWRLGFQPAAAQNFIEMVNSLRVFRQPEQDALVQTGIAEYHTFTANCCKNLLRYFQASQENILPAPG